MIETVQRSRTLDSATYYIESEFRLMSSATTRLVIYIIQNHLSTQKNVRN